MGNKYKYRTPLFGGKGKWVDDESGSSFKVEKDWWGQTVIKEQDNDGNHKTFKVETDWWGTTEIKEQTAGGSGKKYKVEKDIFGNAEIKEQTDDGTGTIYKVEKDWWGNTVIRGETKEDRERDGYYKFLMILAALKSPLCLGLVILLMSIIYSCYDISGYFGPLILAFALGYVRLRKWWVVLNAICWACVLGDVLFLDSELTDSVLICFFWLFY